MCLYKMNHNLDMNNEEHEVNPDPTADMYGNNILFHSGGV